MIPNPLNEDQTGMSLTESMEGDVLNAYQDSGGIWTIGYGHTGPDVHAGLVWTQEQATAALQADKASARATVNKYVNCQLTQNEFDALEDFTFNVGSGAFAGSTLLKDINAGNMSAAAAQFEAWDHCAGKVLAGLLRRRQAEEALFNQA